MIWLLERIGSLAGYDEIQSMIVRADTEEKARQLATGERWTDSCRPDSFPLDPTKVICAPIDPEGEEFIFCIDTHEG